MISRRQFVFSSLLATGAACVAPISMVGRPLRSWWAPQLHPGEVDFDTFASHVKSRVHLFQGESHVRTQLVDVRRWKTRQRQPVAIEQFSLILRGPSDGALEQGTCRLEHDEVGSCELFVVPIHRDRHGQYYEIAFSRVAGAMA